MAWLSSYMYSTTVASNLCTWDRRMNVRPENGSERRADQPYVNILSGHVIRGMIEHRMDCPKFKKVRFWLQIGHGQTAIECLHGHLWKSDKWPYNKKPMFICAPEGHHHFCNLWIWDFVNPFASPVAEGFIFLGNPPINIRSVWYLVCKDHKVAKEASSYSSGSVPPAVNAND